MASGLGGLSSFTNRFERFRERFERFSVSILLSLGHAV
jgi:hypothetical protein